MIEPIFMQCLWSDRSVSFVSLNLGKGSRESVHGAKTNDTFILALNLIGSIFFQIVFRWLGKNEQLNWIYLLLNHVFISRTENC